MRRKDRGGVSGCGNIWHDHDSVGCGKKFVEVTIGWCDDSCGEDIGGS